MSMVYDMECLKQEIDAILLRVNLLLRDRGYTAIQVSEQIASRTVPNLISKWNNLGQRITFEEMILLAEVLDVSLDYLLLGVGSSASESELFWPILSLEEQNLVENYQNINADGKQRILRGFQEKLPPHAFDRTRILSAPKKSEIDSIEKRCELLRFYIGINLKKCIKERKWKQKELAAKVGIDVTLISRYVKADRPIPLMHMLMLCQFLQVYPSELVLKHVDAAEYVKYHRKRYPSADWMGDVLIEDAAPYFVEAYRTIDELRVRYNESPLIQGLDEVLSHLVLQYRALYLQGKGEILALSRMLAFMGLEGEL